MKSSTTLKQEWINAQCGVAFNKALEELMKLNEQDPVKGERLDYCTAWVFETSNYYVLKSYGTYIACIDKNTDTLYDVLRIVYGYTATSAKHISKFDHNYGAGKWGVTERLTARD